MVDTRLRGRSWLPSWWRAVETGILASLPGAVTSGRFKRWPPRRLATRQARGAAQVAPRSGLEFESRSRKRQRPPAAPAHGWPPRGPSLCSLRAPDAGGPPKCARFPSTGQEVAAGVQAAAGGREGEREGERERLIPCGILRMAAVPLFLQLSEKFSHHKQDTEA